MPTTFESWCTSLHFPPIYDSMTTLDKLIDWYAQHISKDTTFTGTPEARYASYLAAIQHYFDIFLPHIPIDLSTLVPAYKNVTTLHYAAGKGYHHFIDSQPFSAAQINQLDPAGVTALHVSAAMGFVYTTNALLTQHANPLLRNQALQLPIHSALFVPLFHEDNLIPNKESIFKTLINLAPDVILDQDNSGNTVFHLMAGNAFSNLLTTMLKSHPKGAFIQNNHAHYPIHTAILNGQLDCANVLFTLPDVINLRDSRERTPLHYAARYGNTEMIKRCCQLAQDLNPQDINQKTPLDLAIEANNSDAIVVLNEYGAATGNRAYA